MFVSKIKIFVRAGNGGKGIISFRREKFVPFGGPDGGNGGNGGNIVFQSDKSINTLAYFKYHRHFFAENGENGAGSNCHGKNGKNCILKVPIGTDIYQNDILIGSINKPNETLILCPGGKGGIGNGMLATSTDRAPKITIPPGVCVMEELILILTLKTDVGLLGAPNAGKSSLINCLSRANAAVGSYAFTTLNPVLGQMYNSNISLMDLPGIIEGAHKGKGKGIEFLKHSEHCKIFLYVIDAYKNPLEDYKMIQEELEKYGNKLIYIPYIIVINKIDLLDNNQKEIIKNLWPEAILISTVTQEGINTLMNLIKTYFPTDIFLENSNSNLDELDPIKVIEDVKEENTNNTQVFISYFNDKDEDYWYNYINFLQLICEYLLKFKKETRSFSLTLTTKEFMISLNNQYRNKNTDTNVISLELENNPFMLGEIILSFNKISEEYENLSNHYETYEKYLSYIVIHGFLHLLGYDHQTENDTTKMEIEEQNLLKAIEPFLENI